MRIHALMTTARAAGFAMAPNEEVFQDNAPGRSTTPTALVVYTPKQRSASQAARVMLIRSRARFNAARSAFTHSSLAALLPLRATA
jgi:hypothetical protein